MSRILFSKALIQLSADGWSCAPSLFVLWSGGNRMGKTKDFFKKLEVLWEHFMQNWAQ